MAGAAIFGGIVPAILRQPMLGVPIQYITLGEKFALHHTDAGAEYWDSKLLGWCAGFNGQMLSVLMYSGLALICILLAKKGADWYMQEEEAAEKAAEQETG